MTKLDIAGILMTYSEKKISKAKSSDKVKDIIADLKQELDMRKLEKFQEPLL